MQYKDYTFTLPEKMTVHCAKAGKSYEVETAKITSAGMEFEVRRGIQENVNNSVAGIKAESVTCKEDADLAARNQIRKAYGEVPITGGSGIDPTFKLMRDKLAEVLGLKQGIAKEFPDLNTLLDRADEILGEGGRDRILEYGKDQVEAHNKLHNLKVKVA